MIDPITKARIALGLQIIPCHTCLHGAGAGIYRMPDGSLEPYPYMHCVKFRTGERMAGSCIPNTYSHFEPMVEP